jgi:hypothetical protein
MIFLISLAVPSHAWAGDGAFDPRCSEMTETFSAPAKAAFNPETVLRGKGLDPNAFRFVLKDRASHGAYLAVLQVFYEGELAIEMRILPPDEKKRVISITSDLKKHRGDWKFFDGKGVGTMAYLAGARLLYQRWKVLLRSDNLLAFPKRRVSPAADKLWRRLIDAGYAAREPDGTFFGFAEPAMNGPGFDPLDRYLAGKVDVKE